MVFTLFNIIFSIVAVIIDNALGLASEALGYGPVYGVYLLALLIPGISVSVRRLHDIGKSGWYLLLALIPCIGGIILIVFALTEGEAQANSYGPDPKAAERMGGTTF